VNTEGKAMQDQLLRAAKHRIFYFAINTFSSLKIDHLIKWNGIISH